MGFAGNAVGSGAGDLLGGYVEGMKYKQEKALKDEYMKAQIEAAKMQAKLAEANIKKKGFEEQLLEYVAPYLKPGGQMAPSAPAAAPAQQPLFTETDIPGQLDPRHADLANYWANWHGNDPNVFQRLIMAESSGNPAAKNVNKNGTIDSGLGQINSSNWAAYGLQNPQDPNENLKVASQILSENYKKFGDWPRAVSAYQMGQGAVEAKGPHGTTYEKVFGQKGVPLSQQMAQAQMGAAADLPQGQPIAYQAIPGTDQPVNPQAMAAPQQGGANPLGWLTPEIAMQGLLKKALNIERPEVEIRVMGDDLVSIDKYTGRPIRVYPGAGKYEAVTTVGPQGEEKRQYVKVPKDQPAWMGPLTVGSRAGASGGTEPVMTKPPQAEAQAKIPDEINKYLASEVHPIIGELEAARDIASQHPDVLGAAMRIQYEASRMPGVGAVTPAPPEYAVKFFQTLDRLTRSELKTYAGSAQSAQEFKRTMSALPSAMSSPETFGQSVDAVLDSLDRYEGSVNNYYNMTPAQRQEALKQRVDERKKGAKGANPAQKESGTPPVEALKEGVQTTFKNGQVWTLQGGKPARIQ